MKTSPIGSKLLSAYAILFAGLAPAAIAAVALANGVIPVSAAIGNIALATAIVYYGARVFAGDYSVTKTFGILVAINYLGLTAANAWKFDDFPADSRAAQMAISRMLRGVLFSSVYIWYFLIRKKTADGFLTANVGYERPRGLQDSETE